MRDQQRQVQQQMPHRYKGRIKRKELVRSNHKHKQHSCVELEPCTWWPMPWARFVICLWHLFHHFFQHGNLNSNPRRTSQLLLREAVVISCLLYAATSRAHCIFYIFHSTPMLVLS
mmetsp:Transcript_19121/g.32866  ORF Transcript_19121/g.32866 Transcript_19121/m.32866 type:complete len:116 (-) Transcript_19121:212-559(-)